MAGLFVIGQRWLVVPSLTVVFLKDTADLVAKIYPGDRRLRVVVVVFLFAGLVRYAVLK